MTWIKPHACPQMDYYRSIQEQEFPDDDLALLAQYMDVVSCLVPSLADEEAAAKVLWHPDLHLDNVFVDLNTHEITRVVDW